MSNKKHPSKNLPINLHFHLCFEIAQFVWLGSFISWVSWLGWSSIFSKQRLETPHVLSIASHLSASSGDLQQVWRKPANPPKSGPKNFRRPFFVGRFLSEKKKRSHAPHFCCSFWGEKPGTVWLPSFLMDFSGWKAKLQFFFRKGHHVWVVFLKPAKWRHYTFNMQALGYPFCPDFMTCQTHTRLQAACLMTKTNCRCGVVTVTAGASAMVVLVWCEVSVVKRRKKSAAPKVLGKKNDKATNF